MSDKPQQYLEGPVVQESKPKLQKPRLYKVLLLNDDFTPMEFVVVILELFSRRIARMPRASCCTCTSAARGFAAYSL